MKYLNGMAKETVFWSIEKSSHVTSISLTRTKTNSQPKHTKKKLEPESKKIIRTVVTSTKRGKKLRITVTIRCLVHTQTCKFPLSHNLTKYYGKRTNENREKRQTNKKTEAKAIYENGVYVYWTLQQIRNDIILICNLV